MSIAALSRKLTSSGVDHVVVASKESDHLEAVAWRTVEEEFDPMKIEYTQTELTKKQFSVEAAIASKDRKYVFSIGMQGSFNPKNPRMHVWLSGSKDGKQVGGNYETDGFDSFNTLTELNFKNFISAWKEAIAQTRRLYLR